MDPIFQCLVSFVLGGKGDLAKMITSFVFLGNIELYEQPLTDLKPIRLWVLSSQLHIFQVSSVCLVSHLWDICPLLLHHCVVTGLSSTVP